MSAPFNFNRRSSAIIKQERQEASLIRQPTPVPHLNSVYKLTLKEYEDLERNDSSTTLPELLTTRKAILRLLKEQPELWNKQKSRADIKKWKNLGVDLFQRTGIFVNVNSLLHVFRNARRCLTGKMNKCFKEEMSNAEMESSLAQWDLFNSFRFYYEFKLINRHFDDEDDDDIEFLGHFPQNMEPRDSSPNNRYSKLCQDQSMQDYFSATLGQERRTLNDYQSSINDFDAELEIPEERSSRKRPLQLSTDNDAEHIAYQVKRAFRVHPEKESLIRKAMFATILEFDDSNFEDLGKLFTSLAAKFKTSDKKYNF